jgi:signal transduction histidine kinase
VDVNKLLIDIQTRYQHQFNQKRITLDFNPAPVILMVRLDPARCSQVITNILENALHYTPEDGHVVIETERPEDSVEISIQDSGIGVASEEAARLFDRFYRADPSRTRDEGGSGLGLAIAKSIIEMHHGRIWAESEQDQGLKVMIVLPLAN